MFERIQEFAKQAREADFSRRTHAFAADIVPDGAGFVGLDDVEAMTLFSPPLQERSIRLNFFGIDVSPLEYLDDSGFYDFTQISRCFRGGATVVFNQCQWFVGPVFHLKRALEKAVATRVNVNAYITPPKAQGFHRHVDDHDVFIIQVSGFKAWTLSGVPPYSGGRFHCLNWSPDEEHSIIMNPGDMLYLPQGVAHCARTYGDEPSIHLTCGYSPARWHNLFTGSAELALRDHVELLDRFPAELAERSEEFAEEIRRRETLVSDIAGPTARYILNKFADRTEHRMEPLIAAQRRMAMTDPSIRLKTTRGVTHAVMAGLLRLRHTATGRTLELFLRHRAKWEWAAQAESFHPIEIPGDASNEENTRFCQYLHSNGFLQSAAPNESPST